MARPRPVSGCRHPGPRRVFSSCRHRARVRRDRIAFRRLPPLLEAPLPFEKVRRSAACTVAIGTRTSHGVRWSPSAHPATGARFTRRFHSPARSVPGDSHPFDGFLRPLPGRACFIPPYAHGVRPVTAVSLRLAPSRDITPKISRPLSRPLDSRTRPPPFRAAELIPGSLSRAFSPSMAARTSHPDFLPRTSPRSCPVARTFTLRVPRSVHHGRIGMFSASCERVPCPPEVFDVLAALADSSRARAPGLPLEPDIRVAAMPDSLRSSSLL